MTSSMRRRVWLAAGIAIVAGCSGTSGAPMSSGSGGFGGGGAAGQAIAGAGGGARLPIGGAAGQLDDSDALIVPQGLDVELEQGGAGTLDLYALTLRDEPDGLAIYAALKNDGDVLACDAALKVWLYDKSGQQLGMFINGLYTSHFYLYTTSDGTNTIAACASIGDVTMTRVGTLATDIHAADIGQVVYYYAYFALDASLIDALKVSQITPVTTAAGTAYAGTMVNDLSMMVSDPSVTVFPLNHVGRPLGITSASDTSQVPAGGSWSFQTATVDMPGTDFAAFPSASFSN
jgi:hypothetical protein